MSFHNFKEYLNNRKKLQEKPVVDQSADTGPTPSTKKGEPKETTPKQQKQVEGSKELAGKPKIDASGDTGPAPKKMDKKEFTPKKHQQVKENDDNLAGKPNTELVADYTKKSSPPVGQKGVMDTKPAGSKDDELGGKGDKELVYEPKTKVNSVDKWEKLPTFEKTDAFLDKTKGMSLKEFTGYMLKECGCEDMGGDDLPMVTSYSAGKFHPYPPEAIKYVVVLGNKNERVMDNLVHEIKNIGGLGKLLKAILGHEESYGELSNLLDDGENGPQHARMLVKSMNDGYSKFMSDQDGLYESVAPPFGFEDEESDEEPMNDDMDSDDQTMNQDKEQESDEDHHDMEKVEKKRKLKKKFHADNLLDAMQGYSWIREKMQGYV